MNFFAVESALQREDVKEEIDALDHACGGGGAAEAVAISYFDSDIAPKPIESVSSKTFLGQAIIINYRSAGASEFTHSYVYEAVFRPPMMDDGSGNKQTLLNNFVCCEAEFPVIVCGRSFAVRGVYYAQQNAVTNVCAHACLRMALNTVRGAPLITNCRINQFLSAVNPSDGLEIGQIESIVEEVVHVRPKAINCENLEGSGYLSILASIVESGDIALLVFTTGSTLIEHVVTVFGHTKNSDEWHPQAIPAYAGPTDAQYYRSASWIDHLLIHDDNFGPYFSLSGRALEVDQSVKPHWIIGLHANRPESTPVDAEGMAAVILTNTLPRLKSFGSGRWFEYITQNQLKYVLRPLLVTKEKYVDHLRSATGHDASVLSKEDLSHLADLPPFFWMVEFSLPDLYTGNHSKLGEVLLDARTTSDDEKDALLALRLPGLILVSEDSDTLIANSTKLGAHSPIFLMNPIIRRW